MIENTIDLVRAGSEKVARERGVTVLEVTNKEMKEFLGRGNDGYIGAHLQTVKIEYARSKLLDEKQVSHQVNAAIYDLLKRISDNSREVALTEAEITQQMFDEICERNIEHEEALTYTQKELADLRQEHADVVRDLTTELQSTQAEKSSLNVRLEDEQKRTDKADKGLLTAREELAAITVKLGQVENEQNGLQNMLEERSTRLQEFERELSQSRDAVAKTEQRADLLTLRNEDLTQESDKLKKKLEALAERAAKAEAEVKILQKTKSKTTGN